MIDKFQNYGIKVPIDPPEQYRTICPKCSHLRKKKTEKCLAINTKKGIWICHHCGWKGKLKQEWKKEWRKMKSYNKPDWKSKDNLPNKIIEYFNDREITEKTLEEYDIQCKEKFIPARNKKVKTIAFPYKDISGEVLSIKYRDLKKNFAKEKNTKNVLFGMNKFNQNENICIICEGEIDTLSLYEAGMDYGVSVPNGAPSPEAQTIKMDYLENSEDFIENIDTFIIATDNDEPGQKLGKELARRLGYEKSYKIDYPDDCKDINDILIKYGRDKISEVISSAEEFPVQGVYNIDDLEDNLWELWKGGIKDDAYSTGFSSLDNYYKIRQYEFTVITGIPQHGKSEFLDEIMIRMINQHDWRFGIFSPENYPLQRHLSKLIGKYQKNIFEDLTEQEIKNGIKDLRDNLFFISPEDNMTLDNILDKAKTLIFRKGINGLILDPFNEFEHNRGGQNKGDFISDFLSKIRRFVRQYNIHIFLVAHPTKMNKEKGGSVQIPTAYDIAGSAHWYNKSDNIVTPFRKENITEIYIQKVRFREIGKQGKIKLQYQEPLRSFTELEK